MYNEEIKARFLHDYTSSQAMIASMRCTFNKTAPFEFSANKDICAFNKDELEEIINEILGVRSSSRRARYGILNRYCKWCLEHNIPGACNGISQTKYDKSDTDAIGNNTVSNPAELNRYLDILFDPITDCTIHNMYRCMAWLAFMGVLEKDMMSIEEKDVDLLNKTFVYNGVKIPIYEEAMPAFSVFIGCKQFRHRHPNYKVVSWRDKCDGSTFLRGIKPIAALELISSYTRHLRTNRPADLTKRLSYNDIRLSGLCYKQYVMEVAGVDPIPQNAVLYEPQYGLEKNNKSSSNKITCFLNDYSSWKSYYNL